MSTKAKITLAVAATLLVLMTLFSAMSVSAADATINWLSISGGSGAGGTESDAGDNGLQFWTNNTYLINGVTVNSSSNPTKCYLKSNNLSIVYGAGSFSGSSCTLNASVTVLNNTVYRFIIDANGSSWTQTYSGYYTVMRSEGGGSPHWFPIGRVVGTINNGLNNSDRYWSIKSVQYDLVATAPNVTNFTITAVSSNGVSLSNFSVTINGTTWTTTDSSVVTNLTNGTHDVYVEKTGFYTAFYANRSMNGSLAANLTQAPLAIGSSMTYDGANANVSSEIRTGRNLTLNCSWSLPSGVGLGNVTNIVVNNYDNTTSSVLTGSGVSNYTVRSSDFLDSLNYTCQVCTLYRCDNSSTLYVPPQVIETVAIFNVTGQFAPISHPYSYFSEIDQGTTSNPIGLALSSVLNMTNKSRTIRVNVSDLDLMHVAKTFSVNVSENVTLYQLALEPNKLVLNFTQGGSPYTTEGYVSDLNKTYRFQNTSFVIIQQNLTPGRVHVRFGLTNGTNHTQFYEYVNDHETYITESLDVLTLADWSAYIRVLDLSNSPLSGAKIRASSAYHFLNQFTYHSLFGQRLTDDEGYAFLIADHRTEVRLDISKEGYETQTLLLTIGDESFTKSEPITVYLKEGDASVQDGASIYVRRSFTNRSLDINGTIWAPDARNVVLTTDYRLSQGSGNWTLNSYELDLYRFNLRPGRDFSEYNTDDITLYAYIDGSLWKTIVLRYDTTSKVAVEPQTPIPDWALALAVLIITAAVGLASRNADVGVGTFFGCIVIAGLINTSFLWLSGIGVVYFVIRALWRVQSE